MVKPGDDDKKQEAMAVVKDRTYDKDVKFGLTLMEATSTEFEERIRKEQNKIQDASGPMKLDTTTTTSFGAVVVPSNHDHDDNNNKKNNKDSIDNKQRLVGLAAMTPPRVENSNKNNNNNNNTGWERGDSTKSVISLSPHHHNKTKMVWNASKEKSILGMDLNNPEIKNHHHRSGGSSGGDHHHSMLALPRQIGDPFVAFDSFGIVVSDPSKNGGDLAVAMPVSIAEDDYIQAAVEYDPDAKPTLGRRRRLCRFRLYAGLACLALTMAALGAILGVLLSNNAKNNKGSTTALPYRETLGIRERVQRLIGGGDALIDPTSPYSQALIWITHNDTMELVPESPNFVQRFILSYVYFATTENGPWKSCGGGGGNGSPMDGEETDNCTYSKLLSVVPLVYTNVEGMTRWLASSHECTWAMVKCDDKNRVIRIAITAQNLVGSVPEGLKYLEFLEAMEFNHNSLYGTIPKDILKLKYLNDVQLMGNQISGTLPEELWNEKFLRLNLAYNVLNGTISSGIAKLRSLRTLYLMENKLSGTIPSGIGELSAVSVLHMFGNNLTGTLPTVLLKLSNLEQLYLQRNMLTGTVPDRLDVLTHLTDICLNRNPALGGTFPKSLYQLKGLQRLDFRYCNFTGTISSSIGNLKNLATFLVAYNSLEGTLPTEIIKLSNLSDFWIQGTQLKGTIPSEICASRDPSTFFQFSADCLETDHNQASVECSCCNCCDENGLNCTLTT